MEIRGTEQLGRVGRLLQSAGSGVSTRQQATDLVAGVQPAISSARANARARLPGGLGEMVARSRFTTTVDAGATVRVRITTDTHSAGIDRGVVWHPTFGHRDRWVPQRVPGGWFTDTSTQARRNTTALLVRDMAGFVAHVRAAALAGGIR